MTTLLPKHPPAWLLAILIAILLSACGFHLRDALKLPPDLGQVRVVARDPYSPLAQSLTTSLERAGANMAGADDGDAAVLRILSEKWASTPISVDQFGRAQEFTLRYAAVFRLDRADKSIAVPQQAVELARDYVSSPTTSAGTESEREILARELQREMASSILRRIDAATRTMPATPEDATPEPAGEASAATSSTVPETGAEATNEAAPPVPATADETTGETTAPVTDTP